LEEPKYTGEDIGRTLKYTTRSTKFEFIGVECITTLNTQRISKCQFSCGLKTDAKLQSSYGSDTVLLP